LYLYNEDLVNILNISKHNNNPNALLILLA